MNKDILEINEAYLALKDGLILMDVNRSYFKLSKDRINIKSDNASYSLEIKEFLNLYKDSKFVIVEDNQEGIDLKKDEEYYNFKHK